jgi:hypothetical protein
VPLPHELAERIQLSDEWRFAQLGTLVEAWGLRASHARGQLLSREEIALAWFREEYEPVVDALAEAGIGGQGTETERYMRIAMLRYLLLTSHEGTEEILDRLLNTPLSPAVGEDTMVHKILKEME